MQVMMRIGLETCYKLSALKYPVFTACAIMMQILTYLKMVFFVIKFDINRVIVHAGYLLGITMFNINCLRIYKESDSINGKTASVIINSAVRRLPVRVYACMMRPK